MPGDLTWVHFVVTFDGTTAVTYIDGMPIGSATFSFGSGTDAAMTIGACEYFGGNPWHGNIDDVRIYNYALTPYEAAKLYTDVTGERVCPQPPVYDFDGDCYTTLADFAILAQSWMECNIVPDCLP